MNSNIHSIIIHLTDGLEPIVSRFYINLYMYSLKKNILLLLCCFVINGMVRAQDVYEENDSFKLNLNSSFQVGILAGGQLVNEKFIYKPGLMGQFSLNTQISSRVHGGIGVALLSLEHETILPIFVDVKGFFRTKNSSFLGLNIGTSAAWSDNFNNVSEFEYEGGLYFSTYYAFQFPISENTSFLVSTGLVHHVGEIEFLTMFNEEVEEQFAIDFLTIRGGIRF